jgi:hypothetical protein
MDQMKRIEVLLVCGLLFLVASTAEARWFRRSSNTSYTSNVSCTKNATYTTAKPVVSGYSTSTAQGVANIMASTGRVGHWGGNTGYEGCGAGASAAAAYNNCCYARSGMATVDVGYARSASGMWFCCRRYR